MDMGFSEEVSKKALAECVWDVNKALDLLLTRGPSGEGYSDKSSSGGKGVAEGLVPAPAAPKPDAALPADSAWRKPAAPAPAATAGAKAASTTSATASTSARSTGKGAVLDVVDASTTASTASSPRSAGRAEKDTGAASKREALVSSANAASATKASSKPRDTPSTPTSAASLASSTTSPLGDAAAATPLASVAPAKVADVAPEEAAPAQRKKIERIASTWSAEDGQAGQLSVEQEKFVRCWVDTRTDIGWMYAESLEDGTKQGWLPTFVLEPELPAELRYMVATATAPAVHDTQLSTVAGGVLKVHHTSRTSQNDKEGWAYAETITTGAETQAGWVPVYCLEWLDA
eukprot:TRINITY_DN47463_c0_g1_i2.p1 TRINITY_DN47463_c0_g1~~TRINITY_DN47463_c0_g1_i2.p1  ORF type:complete len:347 (-),score=79.53 TRINITY_DN47463_c0_g1_i2:233-1273(-)